MTVYRIGPFHLNADRRALTFDGKPVALGPRVVETLLALAERAGEAIEKNALLDRIWPEGFVEESNLTQNVYVLRKTFRSYGAEEPIETVPRAGYRLTAPVRRLEERPPRHDVPLRYRRLVAAVIAGVVVAALLTFARGQTTAQHAAGALSWEGQRTYAIGRYYWNLRTPDGIAKSMRYFERVIDADPESPLGYAAMADANVSMGDYCYGTHRPSVYFARARSYANKALTLDPNSPQGHAALGFVALHGSDPSFGLAELRRAIALDGGYAPAHEWYGIWLLRHGLASQALAELRMAANLEPLSVPATTWLGYAALRVQRYGDAQTYAREALELAPVRRVAPPPGHPRWASLEDAAHVPALHG